MASELILERRDRLPIVLDALRSPDSEWQSAGHVLALALQPTPPEVITTAPRTAGGYSHVAQCDVPGASRPTGVSESLVLLLAELRTRDPEVIAVLQRLLRKVVRHDANLVDPIRTALRILRGILARCPFSHEPIRHLVSGPRGPAFRALAVIFGFCHRHGSGTGRDVDLAERFLMWLPFLAAPLAFSPVLPPLRTWVGPWRILLALAVVLSVVP